MHFFWAVKVIGTLFLQCFIWFEFSLSSCDSSFLGLWEAVDEVFQHISASYLQAIGYFLCKKHFLLSKRGTKCHFFNVCHDLIFTWRLQFTFFLILQEAVDELFQHISASNLKAWALFSRIYMFFWVKEMLGTLCCNVFQDLNFHLVAQSNLHIRAFLVTSDGPCTQSRERICLYNFIELQYDQSD